MKKPKILLLDIETKPILAHVWGLWDNNVALNQIVSDWSIMSWAAKWLDDPASALKYEDQRGAKNIEDDSRLLKGIWKLLNQADIVVTHNGKKFDIKKLNARFIEHGFRPPGTFKHIDTLELVKRQFGFSSNKLEFVAKKLGTKRRKKAHKKYPGHELWVECLKGNQDAWREMEVYNRFDVLVLEEVYHKLLPWGTGPGVNFAVFDPGAVNSCSCGGKVVKDGHAYTATGKFQRYYCGSCGAWSKDNVNLLDAAQRKKMRRNP